MSKPQKLYRGISVTDDIFRKIQINGVEMVPPNPPKIDEYGRKTVGDGNEYGIYMTDYDSMAKNVYGKPNSKGRILSQIRLPYGEMIATPKIGVVYEIEPEKCKNLREPFITPTLEGHYNNGYQGKEYIADSIEADGYSITRISIGYDLFNKDVQNFDIEPGSDISAIHEQILKTIDEREQSLQLFANYCSKLTPAKISTFSSDDYKMFGKLFKDKLAIAELDNMETKTEQGKFDYVLASEFQETEDLNNLRFLNKGLGTLLQQGMSIDDAIDALIKGFEERKQKLIEKKQAEGEVANTEGFDKNIDLLKKHREALKQKGKRESSPEEEGFQM